MLSKSQRAQSYISIYEAAQTMEKQLDVLHQDMDSIYMEPFKTWASSSNAQHIMSGVLKNPDVVFKTSRALQGVKGDCLMWSEETMTKHIGKIFKHFKEVGFLVKVRSGGYRLNPLLKDLKKKKE
jgi:DNA-binding response OmpR family regulator